MERSCIFYNYLEVWGCLAKVAVSNPITVKIIQRYWITFSVDMHTMVMHIDFVYKSEIIGIRVNTIME